MGACCCKKEELSSKTQSLLEEESNAATSNNVSSEYPYEAEVTYGFFAKQTNQLTVQKGEIIIILEPAKLNGMTLIKRKVDNKKGYVPTEYVKKLSTTYKLEIPQDDIYQHNPNSISLRNPTSIEKLIEDELDIMSLRPNSNKSNKQNGIDQQNMTFDNEYDAI